MNTNCTVQTLPVTKSPSELVVAGILPADPYTNDKEYREFIRKICSMKSNQLATLEQNDIDDITHDEWNYDADAMKIWLDHIYEITNNDPIFIRLYLTAAGTMLSEDAQIGLAVLISYDYFYDFYTCVYTFKQKNDYISLVQKLLEKFKKN